MNRYGSVFNISADHYNFIHALIPKGKRKYINYTKKVNSFENLENTLLKIGGRVGNLMDVVQEAMDPESPLGKDLSKKEKDLISKSIIELEEK